jgi:cyclohexadienyl dehydratase
VKRLFVMTAVLVALSLPAASSEIAASSPVHFLSEERAVTQVLELLDQRLAMMSDVAVYKWSVHAPVIDPPRELAVLRNALDQGTPLGFEAEGLNKVFELQIHLARDVQRNLHEQWSKSGFDQSRPVPSLEKDIRPKLDRITPALLKALYLAASELQRNDFVSTYTPVAAEKLTAPGWSDSYRRETLQTLHSIRLKPTAALDRIRAAGVLRIGTTGDYAPFSLLTGDELAGADIELAKSLAQTLSVEPVFVRTTWAGLVNDLNGSKFDLAMGGVSVTPARQAVAAFSIPYASGGKTIVARCKDARKYRSLKAVDRGDVRVIVNPGGTNEQFVRERLAHANVQVFPDNRTIFDEIRAGRADVMITDDVEVELQTHRHKDLCRPFKGTYTQSDKAILLPRENSATDNNLLAAVNAWLASEVQTGSAARRIEQFLHTSP